MISSWPQYPEHIVKKVSEVLRSGNVNYWTGSLCHEFESKFSERAGCEFGIAVSNGTVALELALEGLGIGPGDEVIVPNASFVASASAVCRVGGTPIFVNIDSYDLNIDVAAVERAIGDRTKAVIAVHLGGWPCDLLALKGLCQGKGVSLIEDCSQAHGAAIGDKPVGSFGDISTWSFCQDKIISTGGEGGMVTTNREELFVSIRAAKDHGKNFDLLESRDKTSQGFRYVHDNIGTNARMTELQAAIGLEQLVLLSDYTKARLQRMEIYRSLLSDNVEILQFSRCNEERPQNLCPTKRKTHAGYRLYCRTEPARRERLLVAALAGEVDAYAGSCMNIARERAFTALNSKNFVDDEQNTLSEQVFCLKVDQTIQVKDIEKNALMVNKFCG